MEGPDTASRTLHCSNLADQVDEDLLYELFLQAGPLEKVYMPRDRNGNKYCFVTFKHECSVPYAIELFEDTSLYGKFPKLNPRRGPTHQRSQSAPTNFSQNSAGSSAPMDFDRLLEMSQKLLNPQAPMHMNMPMGMPMRMPMPMPPPPGIPMPVGMPMNMNMLMGPPIHAGMQMPMGMPPPLLPPPDMGVNLGQQWNNQYGGSDYNGSSMVGNSLSQSSLQGNWSARNASHMLPVEDNRRSGHQSRRDRDSDYDYQGRRYHDRDGSWNSVSGSSSDRSGSRYNDRDSHGSRDRRDNDHNRNRDDRSQYRRRSHHDIHERRGRY